MSVAAWLVLRDADGPQLRALTQASAGLAAKVSNAAGILPTGNRRDGSGERARWTIASVGQLLRSPRIAGIVTVDGTPRPDIVAQ
jgi:hypothetical protein